MCGQNVVCHPKEGVAFFKTPEVKVLLAAMEAVAPALLRTWPSTRL
jgi:hypothetical protein